MEAASGNLLPSSPLLPQELDPAAPACPPSGAPAAVSERSAERKMDKEKTTARPLSERPEEDEVRASLRGSLSRLLAKRKKEIFFSIRLCSFCWLVPELKAGVRVWVFKEVSPFAQMASSGLTDWLGVSQTEMSFRLIRPL